MVTKADLHQFIDELPDGAISEVARRRELGL
jgi:hypothetical protein